MIPCLLLQNGGLVKTVKFKHPVYVGDPINAVRIFNDKEVDELLFIDIEASKQNRGPDYNLIDKISKEVFMPFGYGGGVRSIEDIKKLTRLGVEKVCINSYAIENPDFISRAADISGSQSIVAAVDVKKDFLVKTECLIISKEKTHLWMCLNMCRYWKKKVQAKFCLTRWTETGLLPVMIYIY